MELLLACRCVNCLGIQCAHGIALDLDLAIIVRFPNVRSVVKAQELAHASDKIIEKALN